MRLYKFLSPEAAIPVLKSRRLRVSRLSALNDPFEFIGVDLGKRANRRAIKAVKTEMATWAGILCFSRSWHNPVLWGHYGHSHKGICLGFDVPPSEFLVQIRYVASRPPWPLKPDEPFLRELFSTKFVHWSYEDEYRLWVHLTEREGNHYYYNFSKDVALREVIVGEASQFSRKSISEALGDLAPTVDTFKARPAFRSFRVVRNRNARLWK